MHKEIILEYLNKVLKHPNGAKYRNIQVYLFGSILLKDNAISDVDILVIYKTPSDLPVLKRALDALGHKFPLDITYMSVDEEAQLRFLDGLNVFEYIWPRLTNRLTRTPRATALAPVT